MYVRIIVSISIAALSILAINESEIDLSSGLGNVLSQAADNLEQTLVEINSHQIKVAIANTPLKRELGLSNTSGLDSNQGMLFLFDQPDLYGFWMKDMNFAIDIVWLSADFKVIGVYQNIQPESYPKVFYPKEPVNNVLEIPAGMSANYGIKAGDRLLVK